MSRSFGQATRSSLSVKFHQKGSKFIGLITGAPEEVQINDINTGEPAFWDDHKTKPKMQFIFNMLKQEETICDCEEFCGGGEKNAAYSDPDDDGERKLYVSSSSMRNAIAKAIRDAGVRDGEPEVGGLLAVQFTGFDTSKQKPGRKPPKKYAAQYKRATAESIEKVKTITGNYPDLVDEDDDEPEVIESSKILSLDDMLNLS